jgi:hypothetical protein
MQERSAPKSSRQRFARFAGILAVIFIASIFISALPSFSANAESQSSYFGLFNWNSSGGSNTTTQPTGNGSGALLVDTCTAGNTVEVEATAGTTAATNYTTLKLAFDAINAGTHQGAVTVKICASTTEGTTPATLNSNGAGAALYTSVNIFPANDAVSVSGNPVTGFGVIQLNGADNVTINGDNPNTAGTNRNLTVSNTTTTTVIANSAIRIATSAAVTSADNNTIRNTVLLGNVTGGNASTITSTTGSSNSSFGIYVGGNGGATATGAPTAITSVTTNTAPSGTTINNLLIDNNTINQAARAIVFNGAAVSVSNGVTISNNVIGDQSAPTPATPPYTAPATTVYTKGIWIAGTSSINITGNTLGNIMSYVGTTITTIELNTAIGTSATISNNTVNNAANNGTSSAVKAIQVLSGTGTYSITGNTVTNVQCLGGTSGTAGIDAGGTQTSGLIERNKVTTVHNRNTGTWGAWGINVASGTAITVQNNFVSDINTAGGGSGAFSTTFGVHGIRIIGGTGHKIYHNSVNLFGPLLVGVGTNGILTAAFTIGATTQTGLDVRNNIFANTLTSGNTGTAHVSMFLPSSGTSGMNLTINNNDYFSGSTAGQSGIAHVGTTYTAVPAGPATYAGLYTAANFNPADTTATTNLRTYTNTLNAAGTNDNASKVVDPLFVSNTDLHINGASPMVDMGASVGVTTDIDSQLRVGTPDIGADEPAGVTPPANDIAATAIINPANGSTRGVGATFTPQASFTNAGTATQTNVTVRFKITDASMVVVYNQTATIASIAPNQTLTVSFPSTSLPAAGSYTTMASAELAGDQNTANDSVMGTVTALSPLNGTFSVGAGGDFASLTNPGGVFDGLNNAGATGNVVINITSDLTGETGSVALNELAGGFTVTIKPSGAARTITSTATAISVIKLNDADNVTIDGSLSGGTDRSLSITNSNGAASTAVIWVASATNGAQNNTIKNVNLAAGSDQSLASVFNFAIISSSSAAITTGGTDNDNNTYNNNFIRKVSVGILSIGGLASNMNQATTISNNLIGPATFGSDEISTLGVLLFNENAPSIVGNEIRFIGDTSTTIGSSNRDHVGISLCTGSASWIGTAAPTIVGTVTNANISRNRIHDIVERGTFSAVGIVENCANAGNPTANTIANNMIYNILANGTSGDQTVGIGIANGNTDNVVFNSINLTGDIDPAGATTASTSSFGISVVGTLATNLNLKNNISVMDLSSNTATLFNAAINLPSAAYPFGTGGSNFNDWYYPAANTQSRTGATGGSGGTFYTTLAAWQTATTQDANSKEVDPLFVSATDLHLQGTSTLINMGTPITGVTTDFDSQTRDAMPDIGADEFIVLPTVQFNSATYTGAEGTSATVTVTRTGDTTGASTVNYATSDGTATGGASCGAGVDYVTTSGTLSFAATETSKTFNVTLCTDALPKGDETVNLTLSAPTGATLGTPAAAVLTITNVNAPVPGTLALSSATYTVGEAGSSVAVTINRTGGTDGEVSVNYGFTNGTATGGNSCGAGVDYNNTGGTVTFAGGQSSQTFNVTICNDALIEGSEDFTVTLSGATGGATIGSPSSAVITITDDDVAVPGVLAFSSATYTVAENGGTTTITVNRTGGSDGSVTVDFATAAGGTATGGASCGAGVDYVTTSGTLTFANGVTSQTFPITICNDTDVEPSETVNLALSNATGGATIGAQSTAVLTITDDDMAPAGNVVVNPGNVAYMTLGAAIDAINAGTHTGAVTVDINASTTETGPVVLNSSGAGAASYTSIVISPKADGVTVAGPTAAGRGLIELNGADNVTIDGDNPNTAGTNRNLTLQNTAVSTTNFTSVIRIALAATVVNTADNDIFRNLNIVGSSTGRNIAAATSTTASENTTFGILAGVGASTTTATTAPVAITSVSTGIAAGATATNLIVNNNSVVTAARAISINGAATSVFPGLQITGNSIGNPVAGDVNQVTAIGITAQGSTNAVIADNTVWIEGFVASSASTHAINVGVNSTAITGATIERNRINRVRNNNGQSWSAFGINLGGGNSHIVRNNFVSGVINDQTTGTGAFGSTFGAYGIRVASGTGHVIYHNSVHLYGVLPGVTSTDLTAAFLIVAATQTGMDVRNNIFSNQITGGNPTGTRHVAIALPSGATSTMNLTLNNNAYYQGTDANSRMAQVGFTFGTGEFLAENFDPTATTPASNFRAYSSTLSAAGTNDNASFATSAPPPFVSNTDLHIPAGTPTRLESGGAPVGVTTDIDLETRNATTPDIGADEFAGNPPPANDIGAASILIPVPNSIVSTGTTVSPQARFVNNGSATQTNVSVQFTITGPGGYNYTDMQTIATINPGQLVTVTFAAAPAFTTVGTYTMTATVLTPDSNPANNQVTGTFQVRAPITGTVTVGTGGDYLSLTNPGGIFADLNLVGASGNVVINIISDLTAETGAVPLNQLAGGFSVTIKPSGAARVISGTAPANTGLIILNGADNVTIDGSLSGGNDRSLTITNNQTGTSTVVWIRSASAGNGSNNNTIKNCIINGATGATQTTAGILTGSGVTIGADAEAANSNNTIHNNWIYRVQNSMYLRGGLAAANFDQNWVVTGNEMGSTTAGNRNSFRGMLIGNSQNFTISGNLIHGVQSSATTTASMSGIQIGLLVNGGTATNNIIHEIKNVSATGTGANGVHFISTSTASNVTVANNFVYDVTALGSATLASNGFGINVASGAGYKIYHNSVNLNTNQASGTTAAMIVQATVTTAGGLDVRNNIFANTQTAGATRYAFYSGAANTVYNPINYNDYFSTGSVGFLGGDRPTLADWQTATGQDANSKAVDPLFVSATDLHLQAGSPMINMGTPIAGITTDIDGQTRDAMPDIGADEVIVVAPGTLALSSATYSVPENGVMVTVTVNRTAGTTGAVSVDYTLANGTATGGAACGAGVDFVNTGGTVNFADGESSKTFIVQICDDAVFEGDETFTVTLTNPQGGAVLGSPSSATVTIVENDPMPVVPTLTINDVSIVEGNAGFSTATFTVTLTNPNASATTVQYATANGTATAGTDYVATSGTLTFNPGTTTQTITVQIIGDTLKEANETFFVNLSSPTNGVIGDNQGVGIIIDNDRAVIADFDGDRKSDFSVWRPADGYWYLLPSTSQILNARQFGANGDKIVPGDYDGDGKTDLAVFRPSEGIWYIQRSSDFGFVAAQFGNSTDIPVQGDYNGDGKTDLAVFRPSTGFWYIARPTGVPNANFDSIQFGQNGDRPVQGDYDGDAKTDVAVYRNGNWYVLRSSDGAFVAQQFGLGSDLPVVGDFDGDGRTDFTVYRNGTWYILGSLNNSFRAVSFGTATDIPAPADFDGDGKSDIAVFRPSNGYWYVLRSSDGAFVAQQWGQNGDVPVPAAYQSRQ